MDPALQQLLALLASQGAQGPPGGMLPGLGAGLGAGAAVPSATAGFGQAVSQTVDQLEGILVSLETAKDQAVDIRAKSALQLEIDRVKNQWRIEKLKIGAGLGADATRLRGSETRLNQGNQAGLREAALGASEDRRIRTEGRADLRATSVLNQRESLRIAREDRKIKATQQTAGLASSEKALQNSLDAFAEGGSRPAAGRSAAAARDAFLAAGGSVEVANAMQAEASRKRKLKTTEKLAAQDKSLRESRVDSLRNVPRQERIRRAQLASLQKFDPSITPETRVPGGGINPRTGNPQIIGDLLGQGRSPATGQAVPLPSSTVAARGRENQARTVRRSVAESSGVPVSQADATRLGSTRIKKTQGISALSKARQALLRRKGTIRGLKGAGLGAAGAAILLPLISSIFSGGKPKQKEIDPATQLQLMQLMGMQGGGGGAGIDPQLSTGRGLRNVLSLMNIIKTMRGMENVASQPTLGVV